jgi:hypothetical protein
VKIVEVCLRDVDAEGPDLAAVRHGSNSRNQLGKVRA